MDLGCFLLSTRQAVLCFPTLPSVFHADTHTHPILSLTHRQASAVQASHSAPLVSPLLDAPHHTHHTQPGASKYCPSSPSLGRSSA